MHMDGARFANAVASLGCAPKEITWQAGVDVLCFGGTKNGMAVGEAVVFFNRDLAAEFDYRCKQAGQLASKMRYLSAPWVGMLQDGAWLRHARHANTMAEYLEKSLRDLPGVKLLFPRQANAVFAELPAKPSRPSGPAAGCSTPSSARRLPLHVLVGYPHRGCGSPRRRLSDWPFERARPTLPAATRAATLRGIKGG